MRRLKVGTRKSPLAMKQTQIVVKLLKEKHPSLEIEIVGLSTKGDRLQQAPLTQIGGKGVFVKEVEYQLQQKQIDFAVHSLKDMPAILPADLMLAATPKRAMPLDCLILKDQNVLKSQQELVIGTSSIRRAKQLSLRYPQMHFVPIRGKIETRLEKMISEKMDGTVLACAGLERMNYFSNLPAYQILAPEVCVPAIGQGILGVECRKEDQNLSALLAEITDPQTHEAASAERFYLAEMNGNCDIPIGAFAEKIGNTWDFYAFLAEDMEDQGRKIHLTGSDPLLLAKQAVGQLLPQKPCC
ncbi:hydroxymethylbilane synthase [Enterococcus sp.]|uniref:hydroxymethylbilane synthase n=1 Tax=Enterococcus sp. TaxID=35783 RepID=UPI002909FE31|nr:hydroxymethylbilane synthase [Enterococcus sp.]MDU5337272.1 hydroxymethylbilane synthase [Enterococcus sp.]